MRTVLCLVFAVLGGTCHISAAATQHVAAADMCSRCGARIPEVCASGVMKQVPDSTAFLHALRQHDRQQVKQCMESYAELFFLLPEDSLQMEVRRLMQCAEADAVAYGLLCEVAESCFYVSSSPYYNETVFICFLREMAESPVSDAFRRERALFLLEETRKNCCGTTASDFTYITRHGKRRTLHRTPCDGLLLLMFYEPDCTHCHDAVAILEHDATLCRMVEDGRLTLLAVDAEGDRPAWKRTASGWSDRWTVGFDTGRIRKKALYVWDGLPSFYLLDKDKTVVLKDCTLNRLLTTLESY